MTDGFKLVAGEGATLKRQQLEREICQVTNETLRSNLLHSFSKLFMFLEEDIRNAFKAQKNRLDTRLNNHLVEMKPGYDDSITGFNEAWDIMRKELRS